MNLTIFSQDVISVNVLLIGGVLALSLSGLFYILHSRGYIFNDDELSRGSSTASSESINDKSKDGVSTPDSPKENVIDETSPLPTLGKSDDPSLEETPKGKTVELSHDDDDTSSEHSSSSLSSSRTINSDYLKNNDQPSLSGGEIIDEVETVSDYKSALDNSMLLTNKSYSDKDIQTINVETISSSNHTISVEPSLISTLIDMNNKYNDDIDKLRNSINEIYSKKVDDLYDLNLKLIEQNKSMQEKLLSIFNKETKEIGVLTQPNTISKRVSAFPDSKNVSVTALPQTTNVSVNAVPENIDFGVMAVPETKELGVNIVPALPDVIDVGINTEVNTLSRGVSAVQEMSEFGVNTIKSSVLDSKDVGVYAVQETIEVGVLTQSNRDSNFDKGISAKPDTTELGINTFNLQPKTKEVGVDTEDLISNSFYTTPALPENELLSSNVTTPPMTLPSIGNDVLSEKGSQWGSEVLKDLDDLGRISPIEPIKPILSLPKIIIEDVLLSSTKDTASEDPISHLLQSDILQQASLSSSPASSAISVGKSVIIDDVDSVSESFYKTPTKEEYSEMLKMIQSDINNWHLKHTEFSPLKENIIESSSAALKKTPQLSISELESASFYYSKISDLNHRNAILEQLLSEGLLLSVNPPILKDISHPSESSLISCDAVSEALPSTDIAPSQPTVDTTVIAPSQPITVSTAVSPSQPMPPLGAPTLDVVDNVEESNVIETMLDLLN